MFSIGGEENPLAPMLDQAVYLTREENENPELNTVSEIAITTETNFRTRKSMDAESYTLRLSMAENSTDELDRECSYYVWIQKFAVKQENKVEKRMEVEDLGNHFGFS
ncbi:hypothetical protein POTOM_042267 [Populus tomentosa]|uniref:Uncharacterized protein n=1 Tax=Populus tomentosa TaxID=118781 RepID=A0A8X7YP53_POPTO|nr:hypothetical protein POTOM_042267 [Populus tomentosa]